MSAKTYNISKFIYSNDVLDANLNDLRGADPDNLMNNGFWLQGKEKDIFFEYSHNVFVPEGTFNSTVALVFYSEDDKYRATIWLV